jgi:hypothetical protein
MEKKKLPVGVDGFEKLRKENFYYVDKTGLIADLMKNWGEVNLFTRPRRFGKSLNMSMLQSFFEIGGDKSIFDGLAISREKTLCDTYMGKFPVISISLKGVDGLTFEAAYDMLCVIIRNEALRLQYLLDSDAITENEKQPLKNIAAGGKDPSEIKSSLQLFSKLLERHHGRKAIILIDEYDVPLDKAYAHGYYPQMVDLIRTMFNAALKTNSSMFFAVLTGCLRVSKESIFTGLNNPIVHSISDLKFDEYFGFTDAEVREMLAAYGLDDHYDEMREWYDGYLFGGQNVYCPWDVINHCYTLLGDPQAEPKAYWLNTSGNDMVRKLIDKSRNSTTRMEIEDLIDGQTVTKALNEQLTHSEIDGNIDNIWSLLYMTGYLTVTRRPSGGRYELRIPNREIRQIFKQQVLAWFSDKSQAEAEKLSELYEAFESGDTETITKYLNKQLISTVSYYDAKESFYHGFMLALLSSCAQWAVSSNDEAGSGRADIIVEREDGEFGFVIELKAVKDMKKLDEACESAMGQIDEKDYTANLRRYGVEDIRAYAIAFCGKRCRVIGKKIEQTDPI